MEQIKHNTKLLIFDFDGTLIDSERAIIEAFSRTLSHHGLGELDRELLDTTVGMPLVDCYPILAPNFDNHHGLVEHHKGYFSDPEITAMLEFFEGFEELMEVIKKAGLIASILTNRTDVEEILNDTKTASYFDPIVHVNMLKKPKPDREGIDFILDYHGLIPDQAVMIGDTYVDILTGKNANVKTIALSHGHQSKQELETHNPDLIVDNLHQLAELFA